MKKPVCCSLFLALLGWAEVWAADLDWSSVTWPNSSLGQTYDDVGGSGVDITMTFPTMGAPPLANGNTQVPETSAFQSNSPRIASGVTATSVDDALFMRVGFSSDNPNAYIYLTVDFSKVVTDVMFSVNDIDTGNGWQDMVVVIAELADGTFVAPTTLTSGNSNTTTMGLPNRNQYDETLYSGNKTNPTIENSGIYGTSLNPDTNLNGGLGTWNFTQDIVSLHMVYTTGEDGPNNPNTQHISLNNVFFTPVIPEAETYWAGGALLCLLGMYEWRRRRRCLN